MPTKTDYTDEERQLVYFCARQRTRKRKGILSDEDIKYLEDNVPGWFWEKNNKIEK